MNSAHPKLSAIIVGTSDLNRSKNFYTEVFGITVNHQDPTYLSTHLKDGTHFEIKMINEHRFPNWKEHNIGTYKNSEFSVSDIFSFFENVVKNGGSILSKPTLRPWGSYAGEIKDPDDNIFLITQKANLKEKINVE